MINYEDISTHQIKNMELFLSRVQFHEDGRFKSGWVVNGDWLLRADHKNKKWRVYSGEKMVNSFPMSESDVVEETRL